MAVKVPANRGWDVPARRRSARDSKQVPAGDRFKNKYLGVMVCRASGRFRSCAVIELKGFARKFDDKNARFDDKNRLAVRILGIVAEK